MVRLRTAGGAAACPRSVPSQVGTTASMQECAALVTATVPIANAATWSVGDGACYAEYRQSSLNEAKSVLLTLCSVKKCLIDTI